MHRWFKRQHFAMALPEPFEFDVAWKRGGGIGTYQGTHSALLPHEVFHTIHTLGKELFDYLFVGGPGNLEEFWRLTEATDPEFVREHPVTQETPSHLRVPLGMHGDDAGLFEAEKALVLSWNSVAVSRSTVDNRILFGVVQMSKAIPGLTLHQFYTVFVWSMNALSTGKFPEEDHNGKKFDCNYYPERAEMAGKPLAGGYVGAWSEFRGKGPRSAPPSLTQTLNHYRVLVLPLSLSRSLSLSLSLSLSISLSLSTGG